MKVCNYHLLLYVINRQKYYVERLFLFKKNQVFNSSQNIGIENRCEIRILSSSYVAGWCDIISALMHPQ